MKKWEWMDRERDTHPWLVTMKKDHLFYIERDFVLLGF
jgi:hypothetical protein